MKTLATSIACMLVLLTGSAAWGQPAQVSTLALSVDTLNASGGMVMGPDGMLYVSNWVRESYNLGPGASASSYGGEIYKINPEDGSVERFAEGLFGPFQMAFEPDGNIVLVNVRFGTVSRVTPDGTHGSFLTVNQALPTGIAVEADSSILLAACRGDFGAGGIRRFPRGSSTFTILRQWFDCPYSLTLDDEGNIYAIFRSGMVRKMSADGENVEEIANVQHRALQIVYSRADSVLYASGTEGHVVWRITLDGEAKVLAGTGSAGAADGPAHLASFTLPHGIAVSEDGDTIFVGQMLSESVANPNAIRVITGVLGASLVADEDEAELPDGWALAQNYPNPFNPVTRIRFTLPQPEEVTLTVYDLYGRKVATLLQGFRPAGAHEVLFDARALASGSYVYRLQAGGLVANKIMTLLK